MLPAQVGELLSVLKETQTHREHLIIPHAVKESSLLPDGSDQRIRLINTDLASEVNPILPFPKLDQPCALTIVKINGHTVKYHAEMRRITVKQSRIAKAALRCVDRRRKNILRRTITVTERFYEGLQLIILFFAGHRTDFSTNFFPAMSE